MNARKIVAATAIAACFALCAAVRPQTEPAKETPISSETAAVAAPEAIVEEAQTEIEAVPEEMTVNQQQGQPQEVATEPEPVPTETPVKPEVQTVPDSISNETIETPAVQETIEPMSGGMVYVKGFGWIQSEGPNRGEYAEDMYENGNKIGIMG